MAVPSPAASASGRYIIDTANGNVPFPIHGEASWDAHFNLDTTDLDAYLDDRKARGYTALFTYIHNPVAYYVGSNAPCALHLGGVGSGASAAPFTINTSGGTWNLDPTFANHDAAFSSPNDSYHEWVGTFVDHAGARGMVVCLCPMYTGFNLGAQDGWYQTISNSANTQTVCNTYGQYLANGNGTFAGFKNRPNIIWVMGGDTMPTNGSETALRLKKILQGMQTAGDTHLVTAHWQAGYLMADQTDLGPLLTAWQAYTHGTYPTAASTAGESRQLYTNAAGSPATPLWLIETNYWGDYGATRHDLRLFQWHARLSCIGGSITGFSPLWGFAVGADGTTSTSSGGISTAWQASFNYAADSTRRANTYVTHGSSPQRWYRMITAGTSGSTGPTGTGSSISDGGCTWAYVADVSASMAGVKPLLGEGGVVDHQVLGHILHGQSWWKLVPSGLSTMPTLITSGGGTAPTWSDQANESGGMDWIASAADPAGSLVVAYVPHAHSGAFTLSLGMCPSPMRLRWVDPTSGASQDIGRFNPGATPSLTVPSGANAGGDNDWVLLATQDELQRTTRRWLSGGW